MENERSGGVSGALAVILGLVALMVGLMSGLLLGGAGGFFLGRQLASTDGTSAAEQRAEDVASALGALANRGYGAGDGDGSADGGESGAGNESAPISPHSLEELGQLPGMPEMPQIPSMPGVTIVGPDSAFLGVDVSSPGAATDGIDGDGPAGVGDGAGVPDDEGAVGSEAREDQDESRSDEAVGNVQAGALVLSVQDGSAAATAGLQTDDLIVAIDGAAIESANDLADMIASHEADDEVTLTYVRDGTQREVVVKLGRRPGVEPLNGMNPNLEELFDQMPPEMQERFRDMLRPKYDDSGA